MVAGADVARLLRTGDRDEQMLIAAGVRKAMELRVLMMRSQAVLIANEVAKLFQ